MVTIRYFSTATGKEFESQWVDNIGDFLKLKDFTRDELLDLRFFKTDVLGEEIDTVGGDFLSISYGEVEIFHSSNIPQGPLVPYLPYIFAALSFTASILLTRKIGDLGGTGRDQQSATNRLGDSSNEPAEAGSRIDDVFGTVKKHTPPLWQVPVRVGVNNQEIEILYVGVGRGKYAIDDTGVFDGDTLVKSIPNAAVSIYEPYTSPLSGDAPVLQIGPDIDYEIGVYTTSNELNPSELLPPNDLDSDAVTWQITGNGTTATIVALGGPTGLDFTTLYDIGDSVLVSEVAYLGSTGTKTWWYEQLFTPSNNPPFYEWTSMEFDTFSKDEITDAYVITAVSEREIVIDIDGNQYQSVWNSMTNYVPSNYYYGVIDTSSGTPVVDYVLDTRIATDTWYKETAPDTYFPLDIGYASLSASIDGLFSGAIGPFSVPDNTDKVLLNFVAASGFYKLDSNVEQVVDATIEITFEQVNGSGDPTGVRTQRVVEASSNTESITSQVFITSTLDVPYTSCRVSARRTTDRDKISTVSNVDKMQWRDLTFFDSITETEFGDVTTAHILIPSNSTSRLIKDRKIRFDLTRLITQYSSGGTLGPAESYATDDFAQILIYTALDPRNGRLNLSQINADNLLLLKDQIVSYFGSAEMTRFGYDFDTTDMSYEDMFIAICTVVNCLPYVQNGVYDAFFERTQPLSTMQVTMRNKISDTEVREDIFYKEFDGVELSYRNEDTAVSEVIYVPTDRSAVNPDRIDLVGCVTELQATRKANRIRNKQIYNVASVEFDLDEFGRLIVPGQRIDSPDATRFVRHKGNTEGYNVYEGEVVEVIGLNIELSEPVAFTVGEDHYVQFTSLEGEASELIQCVEGDSEFDIVLLTTPSESIYDGYERDRTKYTFCSEQMRESIALIPQTIEFRIDDEKETNTISSINYDSRYYKNDLE